ncbi:nucleotidyltransferase [Notoacmeibacter marinus]|uniref:Nucleotidyltransferase n=1 Tax=Notoacmeibacter marinus TaxID=1876515 RepID=A0A231V0K5_9HYPH|nr:nucleotidyltransferase [Notoacmeibacter marinus]OXT01637.1 nucleotidyltransferase [Notoacmeibacter marinus]
MNETSQFQIPDHIRLRKSELYSILDDICLDLEPTTTQSESAETSYETVAGWLSQSEHDALQQIDVYAHGSMALGTTVRPLGQKEFDVDLICLSRRYPSHGSPAELKKIVGDRLRDHDYYASILEEKKRCWRLNYAGQYHLDISPTITNFTCDNGGELVPDKKLEEWKPTNPRGYRRLFEHRANLLPRMKIQERIAASQDHANIEPYPVHTGPKGILRRIVQLLKRHRDVAFEEVTKDIAPISIIITTLAARSYEFCVNTFTFDTELDVLVATIRLMPHFIERPYVDGRRMYVVPNETTAGENFAERWNTEPERARAFYRWHAKALSDFEKLEQLQGLDVVTMSIGESLGSRVVGRVMDARTENISNARNKKMLYMAPAVGLSLTKTAEATPVPGNTFFGD